MSVKRKGFQAGALFMLLTVSACGVPEAPKTGAADALAEGRVAFRKCATCHCATDPAIPEDEDWLTMNLTTACISGGQATPQRRKALNAYLRSDRPTRPLRIDERYVPAEGLACGKVSLPEAGGSAYLRAEGEQVARGAPAKIRLHWKAGKEGRTLTVPAGAYRVMSYAFYGRDPDDTQRWMMTATDVNGCVDLTVEAGKTVRLGLQPVFRGVLLAERIEQGTMVYFSQTDPHGNVATLSLNGKHMLPEYVVLDPTGKMLHRAVFENT